MFGQSDIHRLDWSSRYLSEPDFAVGIVSNPEFYKAPLPTWKAQIRIAMSSFPVTAIPIGCFDDQMSYLRIIKFSSKDDERTNGVPIEFHFRELYISNKRLQH